MSEPYSFAWYDERKTVKPSNDRWLIRKVHAWESRHIFRRAEACTACLERRGGEWCLWRPEGMLVWRRFDTYAEAVQVMVEESTVEAAGGEVAVLRRLVAQTAPLFWVPEPPPEVRAELDRHGYQPGDVVHAQMVDGRVVIS